MNAHRLVAKAAPVLSRIDLLGIAMLSIGLAILLIAVAGSGLIGCAAEEGNGGSDSGPMVDSTNTTEEFSATIVAEMPVVGDVVVDGSVACESTGSCSISINEAGEYEISGSDPNLMFISQVVEIKNGDVREVSWNESGSWGAAPQDVYEGQNADYEVRTYIDSVLGIRISLGVATDPVVTGYTFDYTSNSGYRIYGEIASDLSWISWYLENSSGKIEEQDYLTRK